MSYIGFFLPATAAGEWLYYKHYPWVYDNVSKDWLYLHGAVDGNIYTYRSKTNKWELFTVPEKTWDEQYQEWLLDPEPYGGLSVLQEIKEAKDSGATELHIYENTLISDLTPLAGLTNLSLLSIGETWDSSSLSDISPLAGLTNLTYLNLEGNQISDLTPLVGLKNLSHLNLGGNQISDLTPLAGLSNLTFLNLNEAGNLSNITALSELTKLEYLNLGGNQISNIDIIANFQNLSVLSIADTDISDLTPLLGLSKLIELDFHPSSTQSVLIEDLGFKYGGYIYSREL